MTVLNFLAKMTEADARDLVKVGVSPGAIVSALCIIRHYRQGGGDRPINWWAKARGVHRTTWLRHLALLSPFLQRGKGAKRFSKLSLIKVPLKAFRTAKQLYEQHQMQRKQSRKKTLHSSSINIEKTVTIVKRAMEFSGCNPRDIETAMTAVAFLL